jgi:hypothetical protein
MMFSPFDCGQVAVAVQDSGGSHKHPLSADPSASSLTAKKGG